jgi:long-chain-fatty-acid---luciferin-component ligase
MTQTYAQLINSSLKDQSTFFSPKEELRLQQNDLLKMFFQYHFQNCAEYRKFCEGRNVTPEMINGLEDLSKIPLLDSFKTLRKRQFLSVPKTSIVAQFCSTGSSGKPLVWVSLDQITLDWMIQASVLFNKTMIDVKPGATLLILPYIPQLKFAVVSKSILPNLHQNIYFGLKALFGKDPRPKIELDPKAIDQFINDPAPVKNLIGFPFTITQLKDYLDSKKMELSLGKEGMIITGGGWKPRQKESKYTNFSREQLELEIARSFNTPVENIRDAYGCTEILLGFIQCKYHRYHVPFWCYETAVDPDDLTILKDGNKGLGACYDFACHSWPAFVLTEDFIRVYNDPCPCGISGQTIEYLGRIQDEDPRGCSFKFEDKLFSEAYLEGPPTNQSPQSMEGLLQYMLKSKEAISGEFIKGNANFLKKAMDTIIETISVKKMEMPFAEEVETLQFVALGKLMCYEKGKPTLLSEQEVIQQMSDLKPEVTRGILRLFEERGFIKKVEKESQIYYQFTKKADEFGEAFYPLLIWALKYTRI